MQFTNPTAGEIRKIRKDTGWYNKTMDGTKATLYHFYQPFTNILEKDVHATIIRATDEEAKAWLEDERIPDGSILLTQFPLKYILSITGKWLKRLLTPIEYGGLRHPVDGYIRAIT